MSWETLSEKLEIPKIPFSEAFQRVINNQITNSFSVAGVLKIALLLKIF